MGLFPIVQDPVLAAADRCSAGWMNSNIARGIWASDATIEGEVASHSLAVNIVTTSARHKATITHRQSRDVAPFSAIPVRTVRRFGSLLEFRRRGGW